MPVFTDGVWILIHIQRQILSLLIKLKQIYPSKHLCRLYNLIQLCKNL